MNCTILQLLKGGGTNETLDQQPVVTDGLAEQCISTAELCLYPTSRASVAQLVRARDCQSLGRRFDSV